VAHSDGAQWPSQREYCFDMAEQVREIAGREVVVTSSDKIYFPKLDLNKGDVIDYFLDVSDSILNCFRDRPVLLQRFPNGVGGKSFFQQRTLHPWPFRMPGRFVDELRIDLDPVPGIGFDEVRHGARLVHEWFESEGITSYIKTSGSKGLHIYVPLDGFGHASERRSRRLLPGMSLKRCSLTDSPH